ncbi:hypothetical protein GWI33_002302 [Rhynchophorus ferrugineus]|uniref:Uncharacterized protein n=1 Tax=Rhynchophorus ferrugineus TaxID=354439 RepID=A0A834IR64_RHYFE|nr:hypothetical protein GWI33_002302 [Rhynchophorus ferrugineus]
MIKISLENAVTPNIKYILAPNKIQPTSEIVDFKVDHSPLVTTSLHSINELGKQLLKAAADGDTEEIKTLLTKGSPFTSDWLGTSPLHLAAQNNNVEMCELLLRYGTSKDARNKVDRTPLHLAAYEGHYKVVESLVKHGADINCRDMLNMTPLHWAVQNGHKTVVELLLKNGALVKVSNKFSLTPHDTAGQINKWEIIELLNGYENESQSQVAADNLIMQLETETESSEECSEKTNDIDVNAETEPVVINLDNNNQISNIEMLNEGTEFSQNHVIINLESEEAKGDNSQTVKHEDEVVDSPITNFKIIDAVLQTNEEDGNFSAVKLLQEHGITMLPNDPDETNILNSVMESGHQVVLTEVGKEVLNTIKQQEQAKPVMKNKIITVTPQQFLQMTSGNVIKSGNVLEKMKVLPTKPITKRVVMKKNRPTPFGNVIKVQSNVGKTNKTDLEYVMKQLVEAKKTIEEYKVKLRKKEAEAERYKNQLKLLMEWN